MGLFTAIKRLFRRNRKPRVVTPELRVFERNMDRVRTAKEGLLFLAAQKDNAAVARELNAAAAHLSHEMDMLSQLPLDKRIRKMTSLLSYVEEMKRKSSIALYPDD